MVSNVSPAQMGVTPFDKPEALYFYDPVTGAWTSVTGGNGDTPIDRLLILATAQFYVNNYYPKLKLGQPYTKTFGQNGTLANRATNPLSNFYPTLLAAQVDYPFATRLTHEVDWCAWMACLLDAYNKGWVQGGHSLAAAEIIASGVYYIDQTIQCNIPSVKIKGVGTGLTGGRYNARLAASPNWVGGGGTIDAPVYLLACYAQTNATINGPAQPATQPGSSIPSNGGGCRVIVEDMAFTGLFNNIHDQTPTHQYISGLRIGFSSFSHIYRCSFEGVLYDGVFVTDAQIYLWIEKCIFAGCYRDGINIAPLYGNWSTTTHIDDNEFGGGGCGRCAIFGAFYATGAYCTIRRNDFEGYVNGSYYMNNPQHYPFGVPCTCFLAGVSPLLIDMNRTEGSNSVNNAGDFAFLNCNVTIRDSGCAGLACIATTGGYPYTSAYQTYQQQNGWGDFTDQRNGNVGSSGSFSSGNNTLVLINSVVSWLALCNGLGCFAKINQIDTDMEIVSFPSIVDTYTTRMNYDFGQATVKGASQLNCILSTTNSQTWEVPSLAISTTPIVNTSVVLATAFTVTGSISGTTFTVTSAAPGTIPNTQPLLMDAGNATIPGTRIVANGQQLPLLGGEAIGGVGRYTINNAQTISSASFAGSSDVGTVTVNVTTSTPHGFTAGGEFVTFTMAGISAIGQIGVPASGAIAGISAQVYNGDYNCTITGPSTFQYTLGTSLGGVPGPLRAGFPQGPGTSTPQTVHNHQSQGRWGSSLVGYSGALEARAPYLESPQVQELVLFGTTFLRQGISSADGSGATSWKGYNGLAINRLLMQNLVAAAFSTIENQPLLFANVHDFSNNPIANYEIAGSVLTKRKIRYDYTAAPTTGAWNVGDICFNSAPVAGGTMGWVCTTGSSPGPMVWKTWGAVSP